MNISGPAAVAKPEMLFYAPGDLTVTFEVPELEKILAKKKKRYVGYEEGMALYSMGKISFRKLAQEAHALLRIKKIAIIDLDILDDYLEQHRCNN